MRRHRRGSQTGLRYCRRCGAHYPASAKWCLICYDDNGHLRNPNLIHITESPIALQPSPLSLLAREISKAGYWRNLQEIAFGKQLGTFPVDLAAAVYWSSVNGGAHNYDSAMQDSAANYLKSLFGIEVSNAEA